MGNSFLSVIGQVTTVALIVVATRWILDAKGASLPRTRDGRNVYAIKWQFPAVAFAGESVFIIISIGLWHDLHSPDRAKIISLVVAAAGIPMCFWLAAGAVTTDQDGITRKGFLHSRSFRWGDITELRVHTKQGGAIELRAGLKKLVIDFRVVAFHHLLDEIKERTKLRPSMD